jgi:hypothetical protein
MAAKLTRLIHKIAIQLHLVARELYHLQFSLRAASPETFGYTLVRKEGVSKCLEGNVRNSVLAKQIICRKDNYTQ